MKTKMFLMLALVMMVVAAPAFSGEATQMWKCEVDVEVSEAEIQEMASAWLKAAKKMEGGANLKAYLFFPIAVNMQGETDMVLVVSAPSFEEWGQFWDGYAGSPAAKIDAQNVELGVVCPDSALWESVKVK